MLHVREGSGEMLGLLFNRYQDPLFNFYRRLTGDRAISEDLVQEVFYRILKYRRTYRPGTSFRAWMYQIARNARVDQMRKQRPETELEEDKLPMPVAAKAEPIEQEQEAALLHRAMLQLPVAQREVLVLSRFQELKYTEIAKLLGCEEGTVKSRVCRALQELRQIFHQLQQPPISRTKASPEAYGVEP